MKFTDEEIFIRRAEEADLPELLNIYNYEVINGVSTFDIKPKDMKERREWLFTHNRDNHPLIVAQIGNEVAGYASLSTYRPREAFNSTVELSVYVGVKFRGRGVATILMKEILSMAKSDPHIHNVVSVITSGNAASTKLHEKFGFTFCGTMPEIGVKFGKKLGIDNYSLIVE